MRFPLVATNPFATSFTATNMAATMCLALSTVVLCVDATGLAGQGLGTPSRLSAVETERSRTCVDVLERLEALDREMEPFARRTQRLEVLARAIALEDPSLLDTLSHDAVVERVREWFDTDQALARRYVARQDPTIQAERGAGRETIKAFVSRAMEEVQTEAAAAFEGNENLLAESGPCDGAIFVRPAVLEACEGESGAICEDARQPASEVTRFRFVDSPESIWEIEEIRPWTQPSALRPGPNGLDGGRTVGYTRVGNVVASVAFTPMLTPREQTPPEVLAAYEATNDSLGVTFDHPQIAFSPALGIRLALPEPLDEEDGYILHFGAPDEADVLWAGEAGTGAPLEATVPLGPGQVRRLVAGDRLTLTAVAEREPIPDAVYAISIGSVNQARNAQALLGYMRSELSEDLARIVPPSKSD